MPKERFHMMLAEEGLRVLSGSGRLPVPDERLRFAYLLGAILPDTLFYGPPTFRLSSAADALHRLQGGRGLEFFRGWLQEEGAILPGEIQAWMLGFTGHLLADGFWHPAIDEACAPGGEIQRRLGFSAWSCHHWLESEMEACWVGRLGPPDGYAGLLRRFRKENETTGRIVSFFRRFLERAGVDDVPSERDIVRCLRLQTWLLTEFARPEWSRWKPWLVTGRLRQYLGSLLVPEVPELPFYTGSSGTTESAQLCGGAFLARAVTSVVAGLSGLPVRF